MSSLYHRNGYWYIRFTRADRPSVRSLGKVGEERARKALEEYKTRGVFPAYYAGPLIDGVEVTSRDLVELLRRSRERAATRKIPYALTLKDITSIYKRSEGRCEVSGIPFSRHIPPGRRRRLWFPSIDRIDPAGGYTPDNCRLVCIAVNIALGDWGLSDLLRIAEGALARHSGKNKFAPV